MKRVVVTGLGAITPLGNSVDEFWENILAGPTSPKVIARALGMVLSSGDYERRVKPVAAVVNVYLSGSGNSTELATELVEAIRSASC